MSAAGESAGRSRRSDASIGSSASASSRSARASTRRPAARCASSVVTGWRKRTLLCARPGCGGDERASSRLEVEPARARRGRARRRGATERRRERAARGRGRSSSPLQCYGGRRALGARCAAIAQAPPAAQRAPMLRIGQATVAVAGQRVVGLEAPRSRRSRPGRRERVATRRRVGRAAGDVGVEVVERGEVGADRIGRWPGPAAAWRAEPRHLEPERALRDAERALLGSAARSAPRTAPDPGPDHDDGQQRDGRPQDDDRHDRSLRAARWCTRGSAGGARARPGVSGARERDAEPAQRLVQRGRQDGRHEGERQEGVADEAHDRDR